MKIRYGAGALLFWLVMPALASGQQRAAGTFDAADSVGAATTIDHRSTLQEEETKPEEEMGTSGFFLGVIGMLAGGAIGSQIGQGSCPAKEVDNECMSRHAYTGALAAGSIMVPIGVHLANAAPRNLPLSLAISALTGVGLYYGLKAIPGEPIAIAPFLAAPLQVVTSIKVERRD